MKKFILFLIFILGVGSLFAQTIVSTTQENKNVILEEFTGIYCGYCPDGHAIAQGIKDAHPDDVFLINIHTGGYASPTGDDPDFRTAYGSAIANQSGLTGYPAGTVNRHLFSGYQQGSGTAQSRGTWSTTSNMILAEESYVNVAAEAEIDRNSRIATIHVEAFYTGDSPETTNLLNVAILQNNTLGPQSGGGMGDNYNHMHRLIAMATGQWGEEISVTTSGTFVDRTIEFLIPITNNDIPIILDDLEIVAFITETHQEIASGNGCEPTFVGIQSDINLTDINLDAIVCGSGFNPSVVINNIGEDDVTSLEINYSINSEGTQTYTWNGTLNPYTEMIVDLPPVGFNTQETNNIEVFITGYEGNVQTREFSIYEGTSNINIAIESGDDSGLISWELLASNGDVVDDGILFGSNQSFNSDYILDADCYLFEISRTGTNQTATVVVSDSDGELYNMSGDWGSDAQLYFSTDGTVSINEADKSVSVYPNPAENNIIISNVKNADIEIYNMLGELVYTNEKCENQININVADFANGNYIVKVISNKNIITEKISVLH